MFGLPEVDVQRPSNGRALPFIQLKDGGGFEVDNEASNILASVTGKIAVVVVVGPYRTGKSFLLNRLIGQQSGFQVGGTIKACTKGIWLWSEPKKLDNGVTVLFLDAEGMGSIEANQTFDTQIFSLAILLSSVLVLNTQGTINEAALEQLELVVHCAKRIKVSDDLKSKDKNDEVDGELSQHFPSFLWVLRDFALQLQDSSGAPMTESQYLEQALQPDRDSPRSQVGEDVSSADKNRIRHVLRRVFGERDCLTLVRPMADEKKLQRIQTVKWEHLREEFRIGMNRLRSRVLTIASGVSASGGRSRGCKRIGQSFVNGPALVGLAKAYCEAINSGGVPTIYSAWHGVRAKQARQTLEDALKVLETEARHILNSTASGVEAAKFDKMLRKGVAKATGCLEIFAMGDPEELQALEAKFNEHADKIISQAVAKNVSRSSTTCSSLLQELWSKSGLEHQASHYNNAADVARDLGALLKAFYKVAVGPSKDMVAQAFLMEKWIVLGEHAFANLKSVTEAVEQKEQELTRLKEETETAQEGLEHMREQLEDTTRQSEAISVDNRELQRRVTECHAIIQDYEQHAERMAKEMQGQMTSLKEKLDYKSDFNHRLQQQVNQLSAQVRTLEAEVMKTGRELRLKEVEEEEQKTKHAEEIRVLTEALAKSDVLNKKLRTEVEELDTQYSELHGKFISEQQNHQNHLQSSEESLHLKDNAINSLTGELKVLKQALETEKSNATQKAKEIEQKFEHVVKQLQTDNEALSQQLSELDRLKQLESELGHDLGQMSQHNKHLQSEFVQEQESWRNNKAKRIAMIERLKSELASAQQALHELELGKTSRNSDNVKLMRQLRQLRSERQQVDESVSKERSKYREKIRQLRVEQKNDRETIKRLNERLQQQAEAQTQQRFKGYRPRPRPLAFSVGCNAETPFVMSPNSKSSPAPRKEQVNNQELDRELYQALNLDFEKEDQDSQNALLAEADTKPRSVLQEVSLPNNKISKANNKNVEQELMDQLERLERQQVDDSEQQLEKWTPSRSVLALRLKLSSKHSKPEEENDENITSKLNF